MVELYASGNVILTDHEYTILSLLRSHKFEEDCRIAVKSKYPFSHAANMTLDNINVDPEKIRLLCEPPPEAEVPKEEEKPVEKPSGRQKGGKYPAKDTKPPEPTKKEKKKLE